VRPTSHRMSPARLRGALRNSGSQEPGGTRKSPGWNDTYLLRGVPLYDDKVIVS
jgi:hypothetical protein